MPIIPQKVKNIFVLRNDRLGEFLLNIPALRALRESFPYARISVALDPYLKELGEDVSFIDEIIEWPGQRHSILKRLSLVRLLKKKRIDIAIMLNPSKEMNICTFLAGIGVRAGYNRKWGFLLTHKIEDRKYLGCFHEVEYNLQLAELIGARTADKTVSLKVHPDLFREVYKDGDTRNLIALHPWTSDAVKQWPLNNFYDLSVRLIKDSGLKLVIVGGRQEAERNREVFADLGSNALDLTGQTTLRQLAAVLARCRLLVSGDSGPMHLAAALGIPVIAIFRNDIPAKGPKRWGPWGNTHVVIEKDNLCAITVEEVLEKVKERMGG
ncbi:MAG: glycosyltransferase family 9 protein [Candidatus Omnitrophota bacterium]